MTETTADANGAGGNHDADAGVEVSDIEKSIKPDTDKVEDVAIHISNAATPTDEEQAKPTSNVTPTPSSIFDDGGEAFFHCEKRDFVWSNVNMKLLNKKNGGVGDDNVKLKILDNGWGKAEAGKTTAIMGASGAGSKL